MYDDRKPLEINLHFHFLAKGISCKKKQSMFCVLVHIFSTAVNNLSKSIEKFRDGKLLQVKCDRGFFIRVSVVI
jgi:hypothetical protein